MTTYAYDPTTAQLLAAWGTGAGATARTVARLHARTPEPLGRRVAQALTKLSNTAWLGYTDSDDMGPLPVAVALRAVREPNLPCAGRLRVESDWLVEHAHDVGRMLVAVGSAGVRRAVVADVAEELEAVERALLGDLGGRAQQAVEMTRLDASPAQIAAADRLLHEYPTGDVRLFTDVEPTAACVAAVHWLRAAVDVTLPVVGGGDTAAVLDPKRAAEPFDVVAPRFLLGWMEGGISPLVAVQHLVGSAMRVARGFVPPEGECEVPGLVLLDPCRPSRHLLDRLTMALCACEDLYLDRRESVGGDLSASDPAVSDPAVEQRSFDVLVRAEADRTRDRLWSTAPAPA